MHRPRWSLMTYHPPKPKNPSHPAHSSWSEPHPHAGLPAQTSEVRCLDKNNQCLNRRPSNHSKTRHAQRPATPRRLLLHPRSGCSLGKGNRGSCEASTPPRLLAFHTEEEFAEILCRAGASLYIPSLSPANKTQRGNGTPVHHRTS